MPEVLTLTINPAIDVSTSLEGITAGRKLRCSTEQRDPGGGGINVARVLNRFGVDVLAAYAAGGVIGSLLQKLVDEEGLPNHAIIVSGETREDFTVFERRTGLAYRFILPGPQLSETEWRGFIAFLTSLDTHPRYIVASGSLPPGVPVDFYARLAAVADEKGSNFVLDSSGSPLKRALEQGVYLVKPNLGELQDLVNFQLDNQEKQIEAGRGLIEEGHAEIVALTLGDAGAVLISPDQVWVAEPVPIRPVSRVGAGDSFLGAMIWALVAGHSVENSFRYGVAAGAAALLTPGTDLCQRHDVERLHRLVNFRKI